MANVINATSTGNGGLVSTGDDSGILNIQTNDTNAITVDTSQNVGIGTSSPASYGNLAVYTAASNTEVAAVTGGANYCTFSLRNSSRNYSMQIRTDQSNAWVLRDETAGANRLSIDTSGYLKCLGVYNQTNPNAANVFVGSGGDLYRSTSSLKYKKNIENSVHGLTDLLNLRSVTYQSNNSDNGEQVFGGLIAEEVHAAGLTEFVQYADDGSPDALAYGNMVSLCVKAIQELKTIVDTQAETINALTARIVALEQA